MNTKIKKLLFCYVIYVILFIAVAFYPDKTFIEIAVSDNIILHLSSIPTFFHSNLLTPFVANTVLLVYFFKDEIINFFKF